jgi:hypothetical protein
MYGALYQGRESEAAKNLLKRLTSARELMKDLKAVLLGESPNPDRTKRWRRQTVRSCAASDSASTEELSLNCASTLLLRNPWPTATNTEAKPAPTKVAPIKIDSSAHGPG